MPLPIKYREPVKDFFAGKITSKELRETIERIDDMQRSFEFRPCRDCKDDKNSIQEG